MKTWDDWSDFEINMAVADVRGVFWHCAPCRSTGHKWLYSDNYDLCDTKVNHAVELPMYCNNPADIWPIVLGSGISVINIKDATQWIACSGVEFESICMHPDGNDNGVSAFFATNECYHTNPLRAAAIVFLMINGVKP